MPSAKTNRVQPRAFRKPNVRAGNALLRAPTRERVRKRESALPWQHAMRQPSWMWERQSERERERAAMQRPCCGWRAQLNTHLLRRLLWSSVTWLKYRNKRRGQARPRPRSVAVCAASICLRPQLRRLRRLLNECACVCPDRDHRRHRDGCDGRDRGSDGSRGSNEAAKRRHWGK